nr:excisionase [Butyrivibrio sp.]
MYAKEQVEIQTVPIQDKLALTIREAAVYSNIGINKLESLLRSPRCPFVLYVGKKKLVKRKEFEKFITDNIEI